MSTHTTLYILHRRVPHRTPERPVQRVVRMRTTVKHARRPVHLPATPTTDYATMPKAAREAMLADLEAHYLHNREERSPFDPSGLPELARAKYPEYPWLPAALRACTVQWKKDELYSQFLDPATRATEWKFAGTLMLDCPVRGGLAIDVLKDHRIGGIEFLDAVMGRPTSAEAQQRAMRALAPKRRN